MIRVSAGVGAALLLLMTAQPAAAQTKIPDPPLLAGEVYAPLKDGCGIVLDNASFGPNGQIEQIKAQYSQYVWDGECWNSLANGKGSLHNAAAGATAADAKEFVYGRLLAFYPSPVRLPHGLLSYTANGKTIITPDGTNPYTANWNDPAGPGRISILQGPDGVTVMAWQQFCNTGKCSREGQPAYSVRTVPAGAPYLTGPAAPTELTWCPDRIDHSTCLDTWTRASAAAVNSINLFLADFNAKRAEQARQLVALNASWPATYQNAILDRRDETKRRADVAGAEAQRERALARADMQRQAAEAQAEADARAMIAQVESDRQAAIARAESDRQAAIAAARREAEDRAAAEAQDKADKAQAAADRAYRTTLATGNPGQLFALADKYKEDGDTDRAREVLRTLISRFPNHALAATAAQALTTLRSGGR